MTNNLAAAVEALEACKRSEQTPEYRQPCEWYDKDACQHFVDQHYDEIMGALKSQDALSPAAAAEGWKLVPVEPTEEMLDAVIVNNGLGPITARKAYKNMLAAAPPSEQGECNHAYVQMNKIYDDRIEEGKPTCVNCGETKP